MAEELAFRGYLIRRLIAADFRRSPGAVLLALLLISSVLSAPCMADGSPERSPGMLYALALLPTPASWPMPSSPTPRPTP